MTTTSEPSSGTPPRDTASNRALDIAHVLFMDIVAYSRMPMDEQTRLIETLQQIVRKTEQFANANKRRQLLSLPTGDGMALVFFGDAAAPARCALEISRALHEYPELQLRMGIHAGPVHRVADINANRNVAGGGINLAQRVMDCGDAGHILVSNAVADVLGQMTNWAPMLHDLGQVTVKHGVVVHLYNLYTDEIGNGDFPRKLGKQKSVNRRLLWFVACAAIASMVFVTVKFLRPMRTHALTEKDTVVLADFVNHTGEPIFDGTLRQALTIQLEESPFLSILSDQKVRSQLRYMGRPTDTPLTEEVAREVCMREGSKAMILGSIASMGTSYVIAVNAMNCQDGESLGATQAEAQRKEEVLRRLQEAGTGIREKLGESLASIQRFNRPLERATTASLDALQAFSQAMKVVQSGDEAAAVPLLQRAIELDHNFAIAYADLAVIYYGLNESALSAEYATRAYALRDNVTEREKFHIDHTYYSYVTGDQEKSAQLYEQWKQTYPRDLNPYVDAGVNDSSLGWLDLALANDLEGFKITKSTARIYANLAYDYVSLDRLDEARAILREAHDHGLDSSLTANAYQLAFLRDDGTEMRRCLAVTAGKRGEEDVLLAAQADTEAFHGRLSKAREFSAKAIGSANDVGEREAAATWQITAALREAEFGNKAQAKQQLRSALDLASDQGLEIAAALALARTGDIRESQERLSALQKKHPEDTILNHYWAPTVQAAIALRNNNPALALQVLESTRRYELGGAPPPFTAGATMYPVYLRGLAYMANRQWKDAAAEFQNIIDHRGLVWNFPLGAVAHLQLARALSLSGNTEQAKPAYETFFSLWREADASIPILQEARRERAALQ
jgi:class 3 adenylate cyclase/tetratricopeptide (TPR) repeat protein